MVDPVAAEPAPAAPAPTAPVSPGLGAVTSTWFRPTGASGIDVIPAPVVTGNTCAAPAPTEVGVPLAPVAVTVCPVCPLGIVVEAAPSPTFVPTNSSPNIILLSSSNVAGSLVTTASQNPLVVFAVVVCCPVAASIFVIDPSGFRISYTLSKES